MLIRRTAHYLIISKSYVWTCIPEHRGSRQMLVIKSVQVSDDWLYQKAAFCLRSLSFSPPSSSCNVFRVRWELALRMCVREGSYRSGKYESHWLQKLVKQDQALDYLKFIGNLTLTQTNPGLSHPITVSVKFITRAMVTSKAGLSLCESWLPTGWGALDASLEQGHPEHKSQEPPQKNQTT